MASSVSSAFSAHSPKACRTRPRTLLSTASVTDFLHAPRGLHRPQRALDGLVRRLLLGGLARLLERLADGGPAEVFGAEVALRLCTLVGR